MSTANKSFEKNFIYGLAIFIMLLTLLNIKSYLFPKKQSVLGTQTQNYEGVFWYDFLQKNPSYIPGWIEIGRSDKVKAIDPNYF